MRFQRTDAAVAVGAELVPDGDHDCEIVAVKDWSRDGRSAVIVTLQPVDPRYAQVEKWLDADNDRDAPLATQLADVLGLEGDEFEIDQSIVGKRLRFTAKNGIRKRDGVAVVYVNAFLESKSVPVWQQNREEPAPKKPAARTPLQKAKAAHAAAFRGDDDVPF
jgi:hypothetical protein